MFIHKYQLTVSNSNDSRHGAGPDRVSYVLVLVLLSLLVLLLLVVVVFGVLLVL